MPVSVRDISEMMRDKGMKLVTAESCTGGMIAAAVTDLAGSSDVFDRGFVTYSNESKIAQLGVSAKTLETQGAVSAETAREMALGALAHSKADIAVAITGIAGPGGGSDEKPVGLVYIATAQKDGPAPHISKNLFDGNRAAVRAASVETALEQLMQEIS